MKSGMKLLLLIFLSVAIVSTATVLFIVCSHRRQDENILMEMVIYGPEAGLFGRGSLIYYFVVKNDGTFISYRGVSRSICEDSRTRNFIRTVHEREQIILNESDFVHISEMVDAIIAEDVLVLDVASQICIRFIHNGNIYQNCTVRSRMFQNLSAVIRELSPLEVRVFFD